MELIKASPLNDDGDIFAVWQDDIGSFTAIHDAGGRATTVPGPGVKPPRLTPAQIEAAHNPPRHPAYDLADKVSERLAKRAQKAAALVEAGAVVLNSEQTAVVNSSQLYEINGRSCTCAWQKHHPGDPCSHYLAVRMARALGQEIAEPLTVHVDSDELDRQLAREMEERRMKKQAALRAKVEADSKRDRKQYKGWYNSGDGKRHYVRKAVAMGATTIRPDIMQRALGQA